MAQVAAAADAAVTRAETGLHDIAAQRLIQYTLSLMGDVDGNDPRRRLGQQVVDMPT